MEKDSLKSKKMSRSEKNLRIAGIGIFTAIVIILQLLGSFIKFGTFSISLVLIPIVIGGAVYGTFAGAWLGLVFGIAVFISGDANLFLGFNIPGTIITVILKGILAGYLSALVYKALSKKNDYLAAIVSAVVCPIVNTGVFLLGCQIFFLNDITKMAHKNGVPNVGSFIITALVGFNFIFELGVNAILSPVIVRLINTGRKSRIKKGVPKQ